MGIRVSIERADTNPDWVSVNHVNDGAIPTLIATNRPTTNQPTTRFHLAQTACNPSGLTVKFDTYDNGDDAPSIDVKWNGVTLALIGETAHR